MPEIRGRPDRIEAGPLAPLGADVGSDDRFAQGRLFELVLGVLVRLARSAPVVLVVEDLHWADPSSRDLLAFLVRNLHDEPILLVATVRTDEPDPGHTFRMYLAELERSGRVDRIDLARFDRDELARLVADGSGRVADPGLVERTMERTGGNPFYAEQVLAATREAPDGLLSARLRDVVLARVAAVSEAGQEVLRVASAAGTRIDDELVVAVSELPASMVRPALREVVERRILVPAGGPSDPHFVFQHALLQEVVHGDLFPGERVRLHAAYAAALEVRRADRASGEPAAGPSPSAAELAYHWDAAGDPRRALTATIEAGQAAEEAYAFVEAYRRYRRALELWDRLVRDGKVDEPAATDAGSPPLDRVTILVRAAETAVLIGDYRVAVELGVEAIALVDPSTDPARAAALQERQRWFLWEAGDRVAAAAAVAEAERLIPADPPSATRARILAHHAGILMLSGRFAESVPFAEEAIDVARVVGAPADEALALGVLGWDLALSGRVDEGIERVRAGLAIADDLGGAEGIALGATNLAVLLDRVGRTADALETAAAGWERVRDLGVERTYGGLLLAIAAKAAIALGRWDAAHTFLRLGLASGPIGAPGIRLHIQQGRLDTFRGDLVGAGEALAEARAADEAAGGTEDRPALLAALAELAAVAGRVMEARAAVAEGLRLAADGLPDPSLASLAASGLRVEADVAARARARRDEEALADARRRGGVLIAAVERVAADARGAGRRRGGRRGPVPGPGHGRPVPRRGPAARQRRRRGGLAGDRGRFRRDRPAVPRGLCSPSSRGNHPPRTRSPCRGDRGPDGRPNDRASPWRRSAPGRDRPAGPPGPTPSRVRRGRAVRRAR